MFSRKSGVSAEALPPGLGVQHQDAELVAGVVEGRIVGIVRAADEVHPALLDPLHVVVDRAVRDRVAQAVDLRWMFTPGALKRLPLMTGRRVAPLDAPDPDPRLWSPTTVAPS